MPEPEGQRKILILIGKLTKMVEDAENRDHLQDIGHRRDQEIRINLQANQ